jgi:ectoine hydroxylase
MRATFGEAGYLVSESLLDESECIELRAAAEQVAEVVAARATREGAGPVAALGDGHRIQFSSRTAIQWEWAEGSREIRLLEPCAHLDQRFADAFADERLVGPARTELGGDVVPFTSKLNFKRAAEGSEFPWHQDYPYWYVAVGEEAQDVVTAIVFLDDATIDNGALRVIPGSHRKGPVRRNPADPTRFLTDPAAVDAGGAIVLEVPAGTVVWFGAFLVHCSSPNRSPGHRRALLPSWQPAGRSPFHDFPYRPERLVDLP